MPKFLISSFVVACAALSFAAGPVVGQKLPAFKLTSLDGKPLSNASLKGKVVLIDFWASWCGPCKKASPLMQKLHTTYSSKGLVVIGFNTDDADSKGITAKYAKEHKYTYKFAPNAMNLAQSWNVSGIPRFILVGRDGKVAWDNVGYNPADEKVFMSKIEAALKK
jgi:thiol-disulfide isomerase/thioredoxin